MCKNPTTLCKLDNEYTCIYMYLDVKCLLSFLGTRDLRGAGAVGLRFPRSLRKRGAATNVLHYALRHRATRAGT